MRIEKGRPICDTDELVRDIINGRISRNEAAKKADRNLDRLIHIRLDLDLLMGELLKHLKKGGVASLGYRSTGSFSVEHLAFHKKTVIRQQPCSNCQDSESPV